MCAMLPGLFAALLFGNMLISSKVRVAENEILVVTDLLNMYIKPFVVVFWKDEKFGSS